MKYIDGLKKYNENKDKWCMPRRGSVDYMEIRKMMNEKSAKAKTSSLPLSKVKLELLNVSGRNNNCFLTPSICYLRKRATEANGRAVLI